MQMFSVLTELVGCVHWHCLPLSCLHCPHQPPEPQVGGNSSQNSQGYLGSHFPLLDPVSSGKHTFPLSYDCQMEERKSEQRRTMLLCRMSRPSQAHHSSTVLIPSRFIVAFLLRACLPMPKFHPIQTQPAGHPYSQEHPSQLITFSGDTFFSKNWKRRYTCTAPWN